VFAEMIKQLVETRKFYQYPSMSGPKIGWNAQVIALFDGSIWVNPEILVGSPQNPSSAKVALTTADQVRNFKGDPTDPQVKMCYTWEPSASVPFMMWYVKRPNRVTIRALNEKAEPVTATLELMRARMVLHEMDHLFGVTVCSRIPNLNHAVPLDAFATVSQWSDDWPSLEARSTFIYNIHTPPLRFEADSVQDADFMTRKFSSRVYPGMEFEGMLVPPSTESERDYYAKLWSKTKTDMADFSPRSGTPDSDMGDGDLKEGSLKRGARLEEVTDDVVREASTEAAMAEPA
jgi:hypothetical protein